MWTNGATVMQTETWNADGTVHDIHYYGLTGAYTDYDVVYANNKPVSASYSNGMTQTWSYNADGSLHELVYNGITGPALDVERHALRERQAGRERTVGGDQPE